MLKPVLTTLFVLLPLSMSQLASASDDHGDGEVELIEVMGAAQTRSHKLHLSLRAENHALADFYAHELEEAIEDMMRVESYDGFAIGSLSESMLMPAFEALEAAIKAGDMVKASSRFDRLIGSCNACHAATDHGAIVIQKTDHNPFLQSFEPH